MRTSTACLPPAAMLQDDGGTGEGGVILLDTDVRDQAEAFIAGDNQPHC